MSLTWFDAAFPAYVVTETPSVSASAFHVRATLLQALPVTNEVRLPRTSRMVNKRTIRLNYNIVYLNLYSTAAIAVDIQHCKHSDDHGTGSKQYIATDHE